MKWIVLGIVVGIPVYTYLTLHYRKPGPAYRPYEDFTQRTNVERLLKAGYHRLETPAERPADPAKILRSMGVVATIADASGGLPGALPDTFVEKPILPEAITSVSAPRQIAAALPYTILFDCALPNQKEQLGGSLVYIRDDTIAIVPQFEAIQGDLLARSKESVVSVTIPGGTLQPGRYVVTLTAVERSKQWTLDVK